MTATDLLLLGIQRGTEAQAEAVDWILARDWPQKLQPEWTAAGVGGFPIISLLAGQQAAQDSDTSSMDTQQVLGSTAAEAFGLLDTASSNRPPSTHPKQQQQQEQESLEVLLTRLQALLHEWDADQGCAVQLAIALEGLQRASGLPRPLLRDVVICLGSCPHTGVSRNHSRDVWQTVGCAMLAAFDGVCIS
jgi:hypothetical protein